MSATDPMPALHVARIRHEEAMRLTATENARLLEQLRGLGPEHWDLATDCTRWTVRDVVVHLVASAQAQASPLEFGRQAVAGRPLTAEIGGVHWVDGVNEAQLRARRDWTVDQLASRWQRASADSLAARRRIPAVVRGLRVLPLGEGLGVDMGWAPIGYLSDMGFTRDVWMHRVDVAQATGLPLHLTTDHDGRIVADLVAEWATTHDEPVTLHLTGPAGGRYTAHGGAGPVEIDAIEFARVLSGRAEGDGVLRHHLPL